MISLVINTRNEADNISRAIKSAKNFADEVVVVDMESIDETVKLSKKLGARVYQHQNVGYVEPARNFAISKAKGDWIFILDADEQLTPELTKYLKNHIESQTIDYFKIPRKNIIFTQWIDSAGWWPDYNIRFFKKGSVTWQDQIHSQPQCSGTAHHVPAEEKLAIIHHHYQTISQYLLRLDRYTDHQLTNLKEQQYQFLWSDLIHKPVNEFLSRYFAQQGYKSGLHGLSLSLLQAFSELVLYLKIWESNQFPKRHISITDLSYQFNLSMKQTYWWLAKLKSDHGQPAQALIDRIKSKL